MPLKITLRFNVPSEIKPRSSHFVVESVRTRAVAEGHSSYVMVWVEQYFQNEGIPLEPTSAPLNPIKLAETLFQEGKFMGISNTARWHATTLIPLANPTKNAFVMSLDSLGGKKK